MLVLHKKCSFKKVGGDDLNDLLPSIFSQSSIPSFFSISSMVTLLLLLLLPSSIVSSITISKTSLFFPSCSHLNGTSYADCELSIRSKDELLSKRTDHCCNLHMLPDCTLTCLERSINTNMDKGSRLEIPIKCKRYAIPAPTSESRSRRGKRRRQRCLYESSLASQKCFVDCINRHLTSDDKDYRYDAEKECTHYDLREMEVCINITDSQ
ncbi:hypothetical protein PRIPAC_70425 [Pristionchus pacificus]|uniref:Uncharacterized protein n=1 Tax=Pristionchus pacificus TaxID=54126 RepID=A0A2A6BWS9_PRIPA|nr:hypothetical protein PRIPAC_70425 [Pristionchus pacificus]|eukprot:PDM70223.1 hypothetical protein PRIPAC_45527 [Pristionchus pacificus]